MALGLRDVFLTLTDRCLDFFTKPSCPACCRGVLTALIFCCFLGTISRWGLWSEDFLDHKEHVVLLLSSFHVNNESPSSKDNCSLDFILKTLQLYI